MRSSPDDLLPATTDGPDATEALGRALGARLVPGTVVTLSGDLGAGKTHLTRGLVAGLGGDADDVSSPTFALVQTYRARPGLVVHHLDAYRLDGPTAFRDIGGDDYLDPQDDAVTILEWPERVASLVPPDALRLVLRHDGERRRIERA